MSVIGQISDRERSTIFDSSEFDPLERPTSAQSALTRGSTDIEESTETTSDFPDSYGTLFQRDCQESTSVW